MDANVDTEKSLFVPAMDLKSSYKKVYNLEDDYEVNPVENKLLREFAAQNSPIAKEMLELAEANEGYIPFPEMSEEKQILYCEQLNRLTEKVKEDVSDLARIHLEPNYFEESAKPAPGRRVARRFSANKIMQKKLNISAADFLLIRHYSQLVQFEVFLRYQSRQLIKVFIG